MLEPPPNQSEFAQAFSFCWERSQRRMVTAASTVEHGVRGVASHNMNRESSNASTSYALSHSNVMKDNSHSITFTHLSCKNAVELKSAKTESTAHRLALDYQAAPRTHQPYYLAAFGRSQSEDTSRRAGLGLGRLRRTSRRLRMSSLLRSGRCVTRW